MDKNSSDQIKKINKLVLSGGGFRGCIYAGVLKYLEETRLIKQINCFAGTSIGALIATLICLQFNSDNIIQIIKHFNYEKYQSVDLMCLFEKFGIDSFEKIKKFIESLFISKNISPNITFEELHKKHKNHLIIVSVCLNTHDKYIFDYINTPNAPVIIGLQASMAFPYIFSTVNYKGLTFTDGGLLCNFPINLDIFASDPSSVLGINLFNHNNYSIREIKTIDQFAMNLFICLYHAYEKIHQKFHPESHVINISVPKYHTFDFMLTDTDKQFLIDIGYQKIKEYFDSLQITPNKTNFFKSEIQSLNDILKLLEKKEIDHAIKFIKKKLGEQMDSTKSINSPEQDKITAPELTKSPNKKEKNDLDSTKITRSSEATSKKSPDKKQ